MPPESPINISTGPDDSDIQDPSNEHEDALGDMQAQFGVLDVLDAELHHLALTYSRIVYSSYDRSVLKDSGLFGCCN